MKGAVPSEMTLCLRMNHGHAQVICNESTTFHLRKTLLVQDNEALAAQLPVPATQLLTVACIRSATSNVFKSGYTLLWVTRAYREVSPQSH